LLGAADEASIAEAESRHLFKPKPTATGNVTTMTNQGVYYTQACLLTVRGYIHIILVKNITASFLLCDSYVFDCEQSAPYGRNCWMVRSFLQIALAARQIMSTLLSVTSCL